MAELTHDTAEEGFHEIQLSGKQLVFLFMLMTVVFVGIFLCGVLVGRSVRAERGDEFFGSPSQVVAGAAAESPETEAPPAEPPVPPVEDELTYHSELEGTAPKGAARGHTPPPAAKTPPATESTPPASAARAAARGADAAPADSSASKPASAQPSANKTPAVAGPSVPTSGRPGRWVVQVSALRNRVSAAEVVQGLIADGYPAFLVPPAAGSPPLYRIQIGRYDDRAEAEQIVRRLAREKQYKPEIKR